MVTRGNAANAPRHTYKTYVTLFDWEWDRLRAEAQRAGMTGAEVITVLLREQIAKLPKAAAMLADPVPEPND